MPDSASGPICGLVVGLINPKGPDGNAVAPDMATDYRNPDPALRTRKVIGMPLIWGFKKTADPNAFEDGQIYNGENGKTYNANISLQPDGKLRLRGDEQYDEAEQRQQTWQKKKKKKIAVTCECKLPVT